MMPPVAAALMCQGETIAAFLCWILLGVETLVDNDAFLVKEHRAQYVGTLPEVWAGAGNAKQVVSVVVLNAELEILLNNVFNGDGWLDNQAARMSELCKQRLGVTFDGFIG